MFVDDLPIWCPEGVGACDNLPTEAGGFYGLIATSCLRLYAELGRGFTDGPPYLIACSPKS
jgi:hypothetical protein